MDSYGDGFWDRVDRVGFLAAESNLDDALFILDQQPHSLATKLPHFGELADAIVTLEGCLVL